MELFPVVSEHLEKAGFINTEGMDSIFLYANVSREEISNWQHLLKLCLNVARWYAVQNTIQMDMGGGVQLWIWDPYP